MANGLKLEGQRFGHLTVLKKLDERENRYVVWLCRCDCGNEIKVNTRHLMRGTVKDCDVFRKTVLGEARWQKTLQAGVSGNLWQ